MWHNWLRSFVFFFILATLRTQCSYLITTPRRWTKGEDSKICVSLSEAPSADDVLSVAVSEKPANDVEKVVASKDFHFTPADKNRCFRLTLPDEPLIKAKISITGSLLNTQLNYTKDLKVAYDVAKTFIQTDKYLYKPGQDVQLRLLTVIGPYLQVSTEKYETIWIVNPSGSRIFQWRDVENPGGLIHLKFALSDEPEEGTYWIKISTPYNTTVEKSFKVEDYILPRYEVEINPPSYILGTTKNFTFEVCAKYTHGQDVKGNLTLTVDNAGWGENKVTIEREAQIFGCKSLNFTSDELGINGEEFFAYSVKAKATVLEEGTNILLSSDKKSVSITRTALTFKDVGTQQFDKPDLPFIAEVEARYPDESLAIDEPMNVCIRDICKNFTTTAKGILKFAVPSHLSGTPLVKAINHPRQESGNSWRSVMYESNFVKSAKRYHSTSNSSLVISVPDEEIDCKKDLDDISINLPIWFSAVNQSSASVSVQVVSRGQIQFFNVFEQTFEPGTTPYLSDDLFLELPKEPVTKGVVRGQFNVQITLPKTASPEAKVLIWYARDDGEVISDVRTLDISECLLNDVSMDWSTQKVQPGDRATLTITAEPTSLCSLGIVDKSVDLLSSKSNDLTAKKVLAIAKRASVSLYENLQVNDFEYCRKKENETTSILIPTIVLPEVGAPEEETPVATTVTPEANLEEEEVSPVEPEESSAGGAEEDKSSPRQKRSFGWRPYYSLDIDSLHMFDNAGVYVFSDYILETRPCNSHYQPYAIAMESNIVSFRTAGAAGFGAGPSYSKQKQKRVYFPETWLWNLFTLGNTGSYEENFTLPDTVTEWVGKVVCVHPTEGVGISKSASITTFRDFFIDLSLPSTAKRDEVFPVKISVFNYLDEPLPIKVNLIANEDFDIISDDSIDLGSGERSSCIQPKDKSVHSIKIRPKSAGDVNVTVDAFIDTNSLSTCGSGTAQERRDIVIRSLSVEFEGLPKEDTWTEYLCSEEEADQDISENWLVSAPSEVVPDSVRGWVTVVGDLMGPSIQNLGKLIKMPYGCGEQNMLNFAPNIFVLDYLLASNQSKEAIEDRLKAFMRKGYQRELNYRHSDGSYSAFGERDESGSTWLTAFVLKCFAQAGAYIDIDENDLSMSSVWLKKNQMENGCFDSVGKVLHKGLKGGLKDTNPAHLTSFVLISLLESGEEPSSRLVREAIFCLKADNSTAPYALSLKTYAMALAKVPEAEDAVSNLLAESKTTTSTMYWKVAGGTGLAVETAAYAILALLTLDSTKYAQESRKIVKWINNKRNIRGGFVSTQDTVVALQALSKFEKSTPQMAVDATLLVDMVGVEESFTINEENKFLLQTKDVPTIPSNVSVSLVGSGCILVQAVVRYNIPKPEPNEAFVLTVNATTEPDKGCKTKRISACASYILPDLKSNMAIFQVEIITGYIPDKNDLKNVVGNGKGVIKRYEVDGNRVMFYVDELSKKKTCVSFRVLREFDVEEAKNGTVTVYDYYKPEYSLSESYGLPASDECIETNVEKIELDIIEIEGEIGTNRRILVIPVEGTP